ncbi:hypothetical protein [Marivirga harenae]|uniref:hypothetical protein n=1 Tax=Marivirga harenae TaxID=2010992 RepID=UPI0026DEF131|nr:hypothetical protein [Marivirga harenae]WKV11804.1 hypothetical protein Q3Y49_16500 [Marivirga harenae]
MKNLLTILLLTFASCNSGQKELSIKRVFPSTEIIEIAKFRDYSELIKKLKTFDCIEAQKLLKFQDHFIPVHLSIYCLNGGNFVDIKERNVFKVNESSEFSQKDVEDFILNNGRNIELSESPTNAIIAMNFSINTKINEIVSKMSTVNMAYQAIWTRQAQIRFEKNPAELSNGEIEKLTSQFYPYQTAIIPPRQLNH